jgi:hypothetical protein
VSTTIAVGLLLLLLSAGVGGDRILASASWPVRYPGLALRAWTGLAVTCFLTVPAVLLVLAHDVLEHALVWALHADEARLHGQYADGAVVAAWNATALGAVALVAVVAGEVMSEHAKVTRERRKLRPSPRSRKITHPACPGTPLVLVPDPRPAAWCCPGRQRAVYVTEGAATALSSRDFEALVAHESAHLEHRHHRFVLAADIGGRLAAKVGLLRRMREQVRLLVELEADDVAVSRHGRAAVMRALLAVSGQSGVVQGAGAAALSVMGSPVGMRVQRLVSDPSVGLRELRRWQRQLALTLVRTLALSPVVALLLPGLMVAGTAH